MGRTHSLSSRSRHPRKTKRQGNKIHGQVFSISDESAVQIGHDSMTSNFFLFFLSVTTCCVFLFVVCSTFKTICFIHHFLMAGFLSSRLSFTSLGLKEYLPSMTNLKLHLLSGDQLHIR